MRGWEEDMQDEKIRRTEKRGEEERKGTTEGKNGIETKGKDLARLEDE